VGTNGAGLSQLRDGSFTVFGAREGLSRDFVYTSLEDADGTVWAGTAGGLDRLENGRFAPVPAPSDRRVGVRSLAQAGDGTLWVGTGGGGLCRLTGGRFQRFTTADGLPSDLVLALHAGADGTLWAGTNGGLARFEDGRFVGTTSAAGLPTDAVTQIQED